MLIETAPSVSADEEITRDPEHDRARDRCEQGRRGEPLALARPEAAAGVPDEMADAAEGVMEQGPGKAQEDEAAEPGPHEPLDVGVSVRPGRGRDEPPGDDRHADV